MSPRRRSLDFAGELTRANAGAIITPFYFTCGTASGEVMVFDLTSLTGNALAHDLARAWQELWAGEQWAVPRDARHVAKTGEYLAFARTLDGAGVTRIEDVTGAHVNACDADLRARRGVHSALSNLSYITRALKLLPVERLRDDLLVRLQVLSEGERPPKSTPRDAYSDRVAEQLRASCRLRISQVIQRLSVDADALVAGGRDPRGVEPSDHPNGAGKGRSLGWQRPEHLAWELDRAGPMSLAQWRKRSGYVLIKTSLSAVHRFLFPTAADLAPFYLLLLLETGIPPAGVLSLDVNCLRNPRRGLVDLRYYKARAHSSMLEAVRDGNAFTPGGIVRALFTITRRLRLHSAQSGGTPATTLWLRWSPITARASPERFSLQGSMSGWDGNGSGPIADFVREAGLVDDEGRPLHSIQPARLRKTHKRIWYERTHGQLEDLAYDHTPQVAAVHYGAIPALRATHEQTAEDGIRDALAVARAATVTVVTLEDEARLVAGEAGVGGRLTRHPLPVLRQIVDSPAQDVFLASCANFLDSPFGVPGEPCPVATWRCLECDNAVVTPRKLPALIAFLNAALSERAALGEDLWHVKFGRACDRIEGEILPQYPAPLVAEARAVAASGGALAWLPLGLVTPRAAGLA